DVKPEILLVDEVLSVGDEKFRRKSTQRITELMDGGTTVILVSHNLPTVRRMAERVMWLDRGRIKAIGDAEGIVGAYGASVRAGGAWPATGPGARGNAAGSPRSERNSGPTWRGGLPALRAPTPPPIMSPCASTTWRPRWGSSCTTRRFGPSWSTRGHASRSFCQPATGSTS